MNEIISTTATDLIPYPPTPLIHENMTFEAILNCLDWDDNNPDMHAGLTVDEMSFLWEQLPKQVDSCAQWVDKLADDAKRAREYARKFTEAARQIEAQHDEFLDYMRRGMEMNGFEKAPGEAFQVAILQNPPSVVTTRSPSADDALSELERFVKTKISYDWDKVALKEALKAGEELDFASIESTTRIKFSIKK